jgi:hypothetical protein
MRRGKRPTVAKLPELLWMPTDQETTRAVLYVIDFNIGCVISCVPGGKQEIGT